MIDFRTPEELREENEYQQKYGEDPNMVKASDEVFTERELSLSFKPIKRVWTEEKQRAFDDFWKDYSNLMTMIANKKGQIIPPDVLQKDYERHLGFWKSAWERP